MAYINANVDLDKINFDIDSIMKDVKFNISSEIERKIPTVNLDEGSTQMQNASDVSITEAAKMVSGKL